MDAAIELAQKNPNRPVEVPAADRKAALDRANAHRSVFEGAEILWVEDGPSNNRNEARVLRSFGALTTFAATTDEALHALRISAEQHQPFDLILSDISCELPAPDPTAGLTTPPYSKSMDMSTARAQSTTPLSSQKRTTSHSSAT